MPSEQHEPVGFWTWKILKIKTSFSCPSKRTWHMPQMILTLSAPVSHHDVCNLFSDSTVTENTTYSSNSRLLLIKTGVVIISRVFPLAVIVLEYKLCLQTVQKEMGILFSSYDSHYLLLPLGLLPSGDSRDKQSWFSLWLPLRDT